MGNYSETRYFHHGSECVTQYFPVAICRFFKPDHLILFVTAESKSKHWSKLSQALPKHITTQTTEIPWGKSSDELWKIFHQVVQAVKPGEEILFDITHGFRSVPMIALLAAAYLQLTKGIKLKEIVYGAMDATDEEGRTPVFELAAFIELLNWLTEVHLFRESGNSSGLAQLLKEIQSKAFRNQNPDPPVQLARLATGMKDLSNALNLIRPLEAMKAAGYLSKIMIAPDSQEIEYWARPFSLVLPALRDEVSRLSGTAVIENLSSQREMIRWYLRKNLYPQAITLGREWIVTQISLMLGTDDPLSRQAREKSENVLHYLAWNQMRKRSPWKNPVPAEEIEYLSRHFDCGELGTIWGSIVQTRNDIDHAGMRPHPKSSTRLMKAITRSLEKALDFFPDTPTG